MSSTQEINASYEIIASLSQQMTEGSKDQFLKFEELIIQVSHLNAEFNHNIQKVEESSGSITSISNQVNMLALNASIEAARAGEYGRGFSVVADNIRGLSDESQQASNDIISSIAHFKSKLRDNITKINLLFTTLSTLVDDNISGTEKTKTVIGEQITSMEEIKVRIQELTEVANKIQQVIDNWSIGIS